MSCFGREDLDRYFSMDSSPDDPGELQARIDAQIEFGQSRLGPLRCWSTFQPWTPYAILICCASGGDSKINYFGSSYGTRIGALYAELFPQRVGRMVLDGAVDINSKSKINQVDGFERRSAISLRGARMSTAGSAPSVMRCCPRSRIS